MDDVKKGDIDALYISDESNRIYDERRHKGK
jgi:hypothetical protein